MKKINLHKSEGYPYVNKKNQGVFASESKGMFTDKKGKQHPYHKTRLTQIFKNKKGDGISMQRPYRYLTFDVEMIPEVVNLLKQVYKDVFGKELFEGELVTPKPVEKKSEKDEVEALYAELNQMRRK